MKLAGLGLTIAFACAGSSRASDHSSLQSKTTSGQPSAVDGNWMLEPGASLDVGCWMLEFKDAPGTRIGQDSSKPGSSSAATQDEQRIRSACIENRRLICGKILDIVPEGLIVEIGWRSRLV